MTTYDVAVAGLGGFGSADRLPPRQPRPSGARARPRTRRRTTSAPATASRASCGRPTSRAPAMCRCCAGPTSCGSGSATTPASRCCGEPAGSSSAARAPAVFDGQPAQRPRLGHRRTRCSTPPRCTRRFPACARRAGTAALYEPHAGVARPGARRAGAPRGWPRPRGAELRHDEPVASLVCVRRPRHGCGRRAASTTPARWC